MKRFLAVAAAAGFVIFLATSLVPRYGSDANWYTLLAEGRIHKVIKPFSGRFLGPFVAGQASATLGLSLDESFFLVATLSLAGFLALTAAFYTKTLRSPLLLLPLVVIPYFSTILEAHFLPDLFYVFLTALFFFLLAKEKDGASLLVLFLMFLTRESTIVLGVVLLAVCLWRKKNLFALAAFAVILLSVFTTQHLTNLGLPNVHNLNNLTYLVLKVPYNFFTNLFGAKLWVSTLPGNCAPTLTTALPFGISPGDIERVGFCGFDFSATLRVITALLSVFGIAPLILFRFLTTRFRAIAYKLPPWLLVAIFSGGLTFFMSIITTGAVEKFAGYGWPAFLLAVPFLMNMNLANRRGFVWKMALIHIVIAWLPVAFAPSIALPIVLAGYWYALRLLREEEGGGSEVSRTRASEAAQETF